MRYAILSKALNIFVNVFQHNVSRGCQHNNVVLSSQHYPFHFTVACEQTEEYVTLVNVFQHNASPSGSQYNNVVLSSQPCL